VRGAYDILLVFHIIAGATGLLTMLVPLAATKGGAVHRRSGWLFSYAMAGTTLSGLVVASSWIAVPHLVKDLPANPASAARMVAQMREAGLFFFLLSLLAGQAVLFGVLATRDKQRKPMEYSAARLSTVGLGIASLPVLGVGLTDGNLLFLAFGALAFLNAVTPWRAHKTKTWLRTHMESMLGGCTAATTAFAAQTAGRITTSGLMQGLVWGLPVLLGLGATAFWTRRLRARRIPVAGK